jgi:hypothetical protein
VQCLRTPEPVKPTTPVPRDPCNPSPCGQYASCKVSFVWQRYHLSVDSKLYAERYYYLITLRLTGNERHAPAYLDISVLLLSADLSARYALFYSVSLRVL